MLRQGFLKPLLPAAASLQGWQPCSLLLLRLLLLRLLRLLCLLLLLRLLRPHVLLPHLLLWRSFRQLIITVGCSRAGGSGGGRQLGSSARGGPPQGSLQICHGCRVLPQRRLHLRLAVLCFLLCLLCCSLRPTLSHSRLLLRKQLQLGAGAARQCSHTLCCLLRLAITLRCGPAQLLCNRSVLGQPPLQCHSCQPAGHSRRPSSILLASYLYGTLQAAAAQLQVLATQRGITAAAYAACCTAAQCQPGLVLSTGSRCACKLRRQGCKAGDRVARSPVAGTSARRCTCRCACCACCLPLPHLQLSNVAQLLRQPPALLLQRVQQAQLRAGPHEGGMQRLQEGGWVNWHQLQVEERGGRGRQRSGSILLQAN